jgi:hypothetical protein
MAKQITTGEQWAILLVPTALIFGLTWIAGRSKAQASSTKGLGGSHGSDCGCGGGLGMVPPDTWFDAGDDYRPLPGAMLDARQRMIKPMPSRQG